MFFSSSGSRSKGLFPVHAHAEKVREAKESRKGDREGDGERKEGEGETCDSVGGGVREMDVPVDTTTLNDGECMLLCVCKGCVRACVHSVSSTYSFIF